ncbi:hypothetical protein ZEAMMB73_Zm00001d028116 [Zea mays]|jgi:hypothetical protein|uniref:chitinase n=1 Tax=Zea mays TaxID=4577 RepID=A0A1D6JS63_MAIZE|nr:hypothetical protein ZEAMMB73_Zm00001d028116 [Zea mays]
MARFALVACAAATAALLLGVAAADVASIITQDVYNQMLPKRDNTQCPANGFYTYDAFIYAFCTGYEYTIHTEIPVGVRGRTEIPVGVRETARDTIPYLPTLPQYKGMSIRSSEITKRSTLALPMSRFAFVLRLTVAPSARTITTAPPCPHVQELFGDEHHPRNMVDNMVLIIIDQTYSALLEIYGPEAPPSGDGHIQI